ncbi:MAG: chitobiase/beta-hexosaminidase C-terminal domain-containing protein [Candidatus Cloacimonetes bacterium]|nr:chitobiase/beta-hexosaminidase C-terminal domain-containing protein [Candidatus Cloacimonadota bacterium]
MKNSIIVLLFLLLNSYIIADTNIPAGNVSGTWTLNGSPYLIEGEITIPNEQTLSIEPGCLIEFQGHYKLNVQGRLLAIGKEAEKIHFTINDTTGFSNPYSDDGSWHSIRFEETSAVNDSSFIIHCILEYGKARGGSNNEDSHGGAIHIRNFSKVRISHSIIRNNRAYYGGGIYCWETSPIISYNTICDNRANSGGGLNSLQSAPIIQSNVFIRNQTEWSAGAIHWNGYTTNNELILINNLITENVTEGAGGGISCGRSLQNGQMINNTISDNSAEEGGGIYFYYINCDIVNCILYGNTATVNGNQVILYDDSSDPNFYYCNIQGGFEDFGVHGGIIYEGEYENNIDLNPCFTMNYVHPYSLSEDSYCINNGSPDISGLNLPDTDLAGNPRIYEGDIPRIDIGAYEYQDKPSFVSFLSFSPEPEYYLLPQTVEITCETPNITIYYTLDGSEPYQNSLLYTTPIQVSEVTTVLAKAYRSGLTPSFIEGGTYYIGYNYFHGEISGTWSSEYSPYYIIEDVTIPNSETLTIEPGVDIIFMGHYRFNVQGRLLAEGTENNMITFTINDNTGFNNIEISDGGWHGIRFDNTPATNDSSRIVYCNIKYGKGVGEDYDDSKGGGIFLKDYSQVLISHCLIDSNKAFWSGAGIYCYNSSPIICYNTIRENESIGGSGIYTREDSSPLIYGNVITYNTTRPIGSGAGISTSGGNAIIAGNIITHNSTSGGGFTGGAGGITCWGGANAYIFNNTIENNTGGFGGGIDVTGNNNYTGNPIITNNMIRNNYGFHGGGLYCSESGMVLVNNELSGNHSYYGGGIGIYNDASPLIINNTVTNNTATYGGGLFNSSSCSPTIINTIIWDNSGRQIYLRDTDDEEADPDFYYCDIQGGIEDFGFYENTVYVGNYLNNIDADPCFMDSALYPFSLDFNSPCINLSRPDTSGLYLPEYDMAANPRIYEGELTRLDMGAYEYQGESIYTSMPEFSIETGIYETSQIIELSCLNPGADIYFTLDGSEPDQSSLFYNIPLTISTNTIIKAKAFNNGLQPSMTLTGSFFIGTLSGFVSGTLTAADSPYNVIANILVLTGDTLYIEPGVELLFHGRYRFYIGTNATLLAQGTESEYITFKGVGNHKWHHLFINYSGDDDIVNYCIFTSGKADIDGDFDNKGGAICVRNSSPTISNCIFYNNSASSFGGAIYLTNSDAIIIGNLIYNNEAVNGGGIYCFQSNPLIINNTICNNVAEEDGGGLVLIHNSNSILINVILWENIAGSGNQVHLYTNNALPDFYYCNIQGGIEEFGLGNNVVFEGIYENCINANPQFIDINLHDYHLAANSPCIDTGTPSGWLVPPDFDIIIDDLLGYDCFGSNYDIGCYEWLGVGVSNGEIEIISFSLSNYPNPFNPSTTISFSLPKESKTEISIYNIKGQKVRSLIKDKLESGKYLVIWHGKDNNQKKCSSGIYFYKLEAGDYQKVRKMIMLK